MRIQELKRLIAAAEYAVDPSAVAEAILRRNGLSGLTRARARSRPAIVGRLHREA
jgi:hypothetical protein